MPSYWVEHSRPRRPCSAHRAVAGHRWRDALQLGAAWQAAGTGREVVPLYAAIFVAAMGLDTTDVAIMIPGVRLSDIRRASMLLEEERPLRRANDTVVEFPLAQPLSRAWGVGFEVSRTWMSPDVSRHLWTSRVDPKRRRHAVGTYTHVLDQWGIVYDQPLPRSTRKAGAAIEGAVRQSITRLERLAVDTHGYTDFGMAIAKLLGFNLCPRLYSLRDRHLHLPRRFTVPTAIANIVQYDVSLDPSRTAGDLLHLAATIEEGWRTATEVLERFGGAARGDRIHRAGHALGQLLRTVYLCDYFTMPDFRRPLYRVLERGESVHALQRQICTQPLPAKRGRRTEELIATSGALTLVTNCVMAWNTQRLQRAVDRESHPDRTPLLHRRALSHRPRRAPAHQLPRHLPLSSRTLRRPTSGHSCLVPRLVRRSRATASFDTKRTRPPVGGAPTRRHAACLSDPMRCAARPVPRQTRPAATGRFRH